MNRSREPQTPSSARVVVGIGMLVLLCQRLHGSGLYMTKRNPTSSAMALDVLDGDL